jgi:hypothetical protein
MVSPRTLLGRYGLRFLGSVAHGEPNTCGAFVLFSGEREEVKLYGVVEQGEDTLNGGSNVAVG